MFLDEYNQKLEEISKKEKLFSLADGQVQFENKGAMHFLDIITKTRLRLNSTGCIDLLTSDLIDSISPDIKFSLANLYLYLPDSNNFLQELRNRNGQNFATYNQTIADKRFFYYVNSTFEKLYNFWDRIGDVLAMALKLPISPRSIYFHTVIEELNTMGVISKNLEWLNNFKHNEYDPYLNKLRIKIVHDRQKDTYFRFKWVNSFLEPNENVISFLGGLQEEKDGLPGNLKKQFQLSNVGFEKTIRLIEEIGPYEI